MLAGFIIVALAVAGPPSAKPSIVLQGCLVSAIDQVQTPARQSGVLLKLEVRRGHEVQQGQVIGQIDDYDAQQKLRMAESELSSAKRRAKNQLRVTAAELSAAVAAKEYDRMLATNRGQPGAVSEAELQRLKLAEKHARLQIELARRELQLAGLEQNKWNAQLGIAQNDVNDRRIRAPRAGVIAEVLKQQGEWVQQAEPVFRIVRMDRLRIEGFISRNDFDPHEIKGAAAMVSVQLARGQTVSYTSNPGGTSETRQLTIDFVSHEIEADGSYRIFAEIENRRTSNGLWVLQPGMTGTLSIWVDSVE